MKKIFFLILVLIALVILYGAFIEPYSLKVNEIPISSSSISTSFDGFKILHFSDLLYDENTKESTLENIVAKINEQKPDIIIFTGDLISRNYTLNNDEQEKLTTILEKLEATLYKYAIIGDNDNSKLDMYKEIMDNANFKILNDNKEYVFYHDTNPIKLVGITDTDNISDALTDEEEITPVYTIGLTHYPDNIDKMLDYPFDLILSGHYTGGIVRIPFYGPIFNKEHVGNYKEPYYKVNDTNIYISNGLGNEDFTFRLFNTPSINLYRLEKAED